MKKRIRAFAFAFAGLRQLLTEPHFRIHILALLAVLSTAYYFEVQKWEWITLLLTISVVLSLEAINSALENLADATHPEIHPLIKKAKDVAAASVLISSIFAIVIGLIIFIPYFLT